MTRSWDVAWRLPSFVAAIALGLAIFRVSSNAFGKVAATIALSAFALNMLSIRLATLVRTDMLQALVIFVIGAIIFAKIRTREKWSFREKLSIFALLAAALLLKGPVVYAFLLPGIIIFHAFRPRSANQSSIADHRSLSLGTGWWPWMVSLAIFLIWAFGGIKFVPGFYEQVVQREFLGRFAETVHRGQPVYFYFVHLLHKFMPWSLVIIALATIQGRTINVRKAFSGVRPEVLWLICWALGGLFVMSIVPSKRVDRIFPVIPPLCLLLAAQTEVLGRTILESKARRWYAFVLLFAAVYCASYSSWKLYSGYRDNRAALADFGREVRDLSAKENLRYEAIGRNDEGIPLYLRRPAFISRTQAIADWNAGRLDAVAVPLDEAERLMPQLQGATITLTSGERRHLDRPRYVLLAR